MPNLTTTIEDTSPVIIYSGDWQVGSSTNDVFVERYSESSYMRTNISLASASFTFYGNGVQIFGAKRQNYSRYQVSIDSKVYPIRDASVSDPQGTFQTSLFNTLGLAVGYHTVRLTNIDRAPLDLDFITWQTPVGSDYDTITVVTAQDSESSFAYTPPSQWSPNVPNPGMFSGGSGHVTYTGNSSVKFTFEVRSAVQLFGPVGPSCASYSVSLDNGNPLNYSAYKPFYRPDQLLFQASNLAGGEHSFTVRPAPGTNSSVYFAIDYVQVFKTSSGSGQPNLSVAQIVGIVVGSVCGLLLLGLLGFLFRSKRGQYLLLRKKQEDDVGESAVIEPFNDLQTPPVTTPLYDTQAFTPQNLKGQPSRGTMEQRYSQDPTASTFSGDNLYIPTELAPLPLSPLRPSSAHWPSESPVRSPRILDEKRRPHSDTPGESMSEMSQSTSVPPVVSSQTFQDSPPVYLK